MISKDFSFYKGKKVLITGHTGFKGSWMCSLLLMLDAEVIGIGLEPPTKPSLFELCNLQDRMNSVIGDVRNLDLLQKVFRENKPEIVIHMAAQPIVRESYRNPVYTYDVNVMGTVNVLECIRNTTSVRSFVNVTTDKVYHNKEWEWGYRESDELNGYDPYSNSKSCSELVTNSYKNSFFQDNSVAISTARAGNVIGGGDFASNRIIPDCVRAIIENQSIVVRNPYSTRPYQHVLEPIYAYLLIAMNQYLDSSVSGNYNVGPDDADCVTTGELVSLFCNSWEKRSGNKVNWLTRHDGGPHEANFLKLDCSKMKRIFEWKPRWNVEQAMDKLVEWYYVYSVNSDVVACLETQVKEILQNE